MNLLQQSNRPSIAKLFKCTFKNRTALKILSRIVIVLLVWGIALGISLAENADEQKTLPTLSDDSIRVYIRENGTISQIESKNGENWEKILFRGALYTVKSDSKGGHQIKE